MRRAGSFLAVLALALPLAAAAVTVEPSPVRISAGFNGTTVHVRGTTDPKTAVFVVISGKTTEEKFNRKGRVGPVWATVGKVQVAGAPRLHLVAGSTAAGRVLDRATVDRYLLDLDALAGRLQVTAPGADVAKMRREYLKLKREQRVVGVFDDGVRLEDGAAGTAFVADLPWPDVAAPGTYEISVLHVRDGKVVRSESSSLQVELVGLPRFIAHMAFDRAALYGVTAIIVALAVGFLMGLVFKRKGGGGH
jgi:hypothetical protein